MTTLTTGKATEFITFTRASNATVTDSDGKIKWAPHNLLTNSESFDAAAWGTTAGVTLTANNAVAPNGTTTADHYAATNTINYKGQTGITVIATQYTQSCFAKRVNTDWVYMNIQNSTDKGAWFNLATGVKGIEESGVTAAIQSVGSGWYLCSIAFTGIAGNAVVVLPRPRDGDGSTTTTVGGSVLLWGAHLYRSDLGGMQPNTSAYPMYNPTTVKNMLGYTEDFSNAAWSKVNIAAFGSGSVSNAILSPNGLQTADLLVESTANSEHALVQSGGTQGVSTYSVFARYAGRNMSLRVYSATNLFVTVTFDIQNGAVTQTNNVGTTFSSVSSSITSVGSGWYRCSVTTTRAPGTTLYCVNLTNTLTPSLTADGSPSYTGDGTSGIYIWGAQLSDSASLDTYVPQYGAAVTSAAYYGPRRDFDPVTLACKGLLVEEQRANLSQYSAQFDNIYWVPSGLKAFGSGSVVNTTATLDPAGTNTAEFIQEDTATSGHAIYGSSTLTAVAHTFSVYCKKAGRSWVYIRLATAPGQGAYFNLDTGAVGTVQSGITAHPPVSVGNGWYRCAVTITASTAAWYFQVGPSLADNTASYAGDGTSGLYIWGAQLEAGSFATSYIPTGAATATRNADVASVSTQAFPYSASAGSLVINYNYIGGQSAPYPVGLDNGSGLTVFSGIRQNTSQFNTDQGAVTISPSVNSTGLNKVAFAQTTNDRAVSANGNAANTSTATYNPGTATTLSIGLIGNSPSSYGMTGHIRQITYLPRRVSNAELVTRSA